MNINPATATIEMLHKIAAHPWVYDQIQVLAGREQVLNRILRSTVALRAETVVDVGGGQERGGGYGQRAAVMSVWTLRC